MSFEIIFGDYIFCDLLFAKIQFCIMFSFSFVHCVFKLYGITCFFESFTHFPPRWIAFCDRHYFSLFSALLIGLQIRDFETYAADNFLSNACGQLMRRSLESSHLDVHQRIAYITHWPSQLVPSALAVVELSVDPEGWNMGVISFHKEIHLTNLGG